MKTREPIFNFTEPVPVWLCGGLIALHLIYSLLPSGFQDSVNSYALLAAINGDVDVGRGGPSSIPSLLLHGFRHADWGHVLMNSAMIAVFGVLVCRAAGSGWRASARFIVIFLLGIIAGGLAQWGWWMLASETGSAVGASGGASGLLAAAAYVLGGRTQLLNWGLGWLVINLLVVLAGVLGIMSMNIAWAAHLGGYVGGGGAALFFLKPRSTDFKFTR